MSHGLREATESQDVVHVALDESFKPLWLVGAVVADREFDPLNSKIQEAYEEAADAYHMEGLKSFEKFVKDGFHRSADPPEVAHNFVSFLAKAVEFKTFLFFSDPDRATRSRNKTVILLYHELIKTIIQKYRNRSVIRFYFETNEELEKYFLPLVARAKKSAGRVRARLEVEIRSKFSPQMVAVCDYSMLIFARWFKGVQSHDERNSIPALTQNPRDFTWREFKAIRKTISVIRSLELGTVAERMLPGDAVL